MQLDPAAAAAGVRLVIHDSLGSTNAEALTLARGGERGPLWIVAHRQSAGRGRRGRKWTSEPGNLYATLLLSDLGASASVAQLSFVAALAVHDAITVAASGIAPLALKWPNDVLWGGKKICGILLEGESFAAASAVVTVGIGVNCKHHPRDTEFPATDLAAEGIMAAPDQVFYALSRTMMLRVDQWRSGAGFAATRADWLSRAAGIGQPLRVRLHDRETTGVFEALDERGQLLLRKSDGTIEAVTAGDVFPLQAEHT